MWELRVFGQLLEEVCGSFGPGPSYAICNKQLILSLTKTKTHDESQWIFDTCSFRRNAIVMRSNEVWGGWKDRGHTAAAGEYGAQQTYCSCSLGTTIWEIKWAWLVASNNLPVCLSWCMGANNLGNQMQDLQLATQCNPFSLANKSQCRARY